MPLLLLLSLLASGCSRQFYRRQADRETGYLVREKSVGTPWEVPRDYSIQPDPRARFFDPTDPNFPTLPPAGPNLYQYRLPALRGRGDWQAEQLPDTAPGTMSETLEMPAPPVPPPSIAPPTAFSPLPGPALQLVAYQEAVRSNQPPPPEENVDRVDPFVVYDRGSGSALDKDKIQPIDPRFWKEVPDYCLARMLEFEAIREEYKDTFKREVSADLLDDAPRLVFEEIFELALLNSREYQTQKESLYRAALTASLERYAYVSKFSVAGNGVDTTYTHNRFNGITVNSLSVPSSLRGSKTLSTAGNVVGQFANSILLTFNGPDGFAADVSSELLFEVTQSVLQRDVVLNSLIQAERDLVYAARTYARFRREFFFDIASTYYDFLKTYRNVDIQSQNFFAQIRAFQQGQAEVRSDFSRAPNQIGVNQFEDRVLAGLRSVITSCNSVEQRLDTLKITIGIPTETRINVDLTELEELTRRDEIAVERDRSRRWRDRLETQLGRDSINLPDLLNTNYRLAQRIVTWLDYRQELDPATPDISELKKLRSRFKLDAARLDAATEQAMLERVRQAGLQDAQPQAIPQPGQPGQGDDQLVAPPSPRIIVFQRQLDTITALFELVRSQGQYLTTLGASSDVLDPFRERLWNQEDAVVELEKNIDLALEDPEQLDITSLLDEANAVLAAMTVLSQDLDATTFDQPPRVVTLEDSTAESVELMRISDQLFESMQEDLPAIRISADEAMVTALVQRLDLMNRRGELADRWRNIKIAADELRSFLDLNARQVIRTEKNRPFDFSFRNSTTRLGLSFDLPLNRRAQRNLYRRSLIDYNVNLRGLQLFEDNIKLSVRNGLRDLGLARVSYPINIAQAALAKEQVDSTRKQLQLGSADVRPLDVLDALRSEREALLQVASTRIDYIIDRAQFALSLEGLLLDDLGYWPDLNRPDYQPQANMVYPWNAGSAYGEFPSFLKVSHELKRMLNYPPPSGSIPQETANERRSDPTADQPVADPQEIDSGL